jgi:Fe-S-cluster containining protein
MIKQLIPSGFCLDCQGCCRFNEQNSVWLPCLLDEEIQKLLDTKIPPATISINKKVQPLANPSDEGFICAFFDIAMNKCKIYDFRPFECQLYPFLINLRDKKIILTVDLNCPYIKKKIDCQELKEYSKYLAAFLNSPKQISILKDNPQIIQAYEEVAEVLELKISDEPRPS